MPAQDATATPAPKITPKRMDHLHSKEGLFIVIEANIGAGKTEFSNMLARLRDVTDGACEVMFEPIGTSRFRRLLGLYYQDPARWGFTFQMHALQARFKQHTLAAEMVANGRSVVQDRSIYADGCFGTTVHEDGNMSDDEWGIYADTFGSLKRYLRYPDVMVYLKTDPLVCYERMRRRARREESGVPLDYLKRISDKHDELADEMANYTRVLVLDWNEFGGDVEEINRQINEIADEPRRFMRDWRRI